VEDPPARHSDLSTIDVILTSAAQIPAQHLLSACGLTKGLDFVRHIEHLAEEFFMRPVFSVFCRAQSAPHMLERKTSAQRRPSASLRGTPVIFSAARLNEVTRHSPSTVNTPSDMLSKIAFVAVGFSVAELWFFRFMADSWNQCTSARPRRHQKDWV